MGVFERAPFGQGTDRLYPYFFRRHLCADPIPEKDEGGKSNIEEMNVFFVRFSYIKWFFVLFLYKK